MPPAVRRVSVPDALNAFAAQADLVCGWASGDINLGACSRIAQWSVRDVLAHLSMAVAPLSGAEAARGATVPLSQYVESYAIDAAEIADQPASFAGDPRASLSAAATAVSARRSWPTTISMFGERLSAADAVATRVLELVVHGDDLGISPHPVALGLSCRLLTGILATRQPGRSVELRVAPYAAVQVLEGTVHRRGKPTAVVSVEPATWVRLATGRLSWTEAESAGVLTASGERSDLSPYLPLLR